MESKWTPQMMRLLDIDARSLPIIWDADFLYGPRDRPAKTPMCFARSMSARYFHFPSRRLRRSRDSHWSTSVVKKAHESHRFVT